jgi:F-type H+-transporting ATPase subunit epsilon
MPLQVELVSPERILFSGEAEMVTCRTGSGDIAFLTGHAPFLGSLEIFPVAIHLTDGSVEHAAVHGGIVEVSNSRVIILSDQAELKDQIDVEQALRDKEDAERRLAETDDAECEAQLRRAHARLVVAGHPSV